MNSSIFLDTPVFFHCIEHDRFRTIPDHANNAGYKRLLHRLNEMSPTVITPKHSLKQMKSDKTS